MRGVALLFSMCLFGVFSAAPALSQELARIERGAGPLSWLGNPPLRSPITFTAAPDSENVLITDSTGTVYPYAVRSPEERAFRARIPKPSPVPTLSDTVSDAIHALTQKEYREGLRGVDVTSRVGLFLLRHPEWVENAWWDEHSISYRVRGDLTETVAIFHGPERPLPPRWVQLSNYIRPTVESLRMGRAVFIAYNGRGVTVSVKTAEGFWRLQAVDIDNELAELIRHPIDRVTLLPQ